MNNTDPNQEPITHTRPILVLGATGKTGSRIVSRLTELGVPTRIGSRAGHPPFDWQDRATWAPAVRGVRAVYLAYAPDLAVPGAPDDVAAFVRIAADSEVEHIVLLSGRGEPEAQECERIVRDSGVDWTILRSSFFAQNFGESFWRDELLATGELTLPVGDVGEPFIDADDIAAVAVRALTRPGHVGQLYELTGPRLLTFADAVREVADASGREVKFRAVSAEEYIEAMAAYDVPTDVQSLLTYLFTEVMDGRNAYLVDGVERALGRPAGDFRDYARSAAASGVWNG